MNSLPENIEIRNFEHGFDIYKESVDLRTRILLEPLGREDAASDYDFPEKDVYIGAFHGEKLVGTVILTPLDKHTVKMRQLAVDPAYRGRYIGLTLVDASEKAARTKGFRLMTLHARESAVAFYEKLDYRCLGERFLEIDIPHWEMEKEL
ncbi:MAG: GNAT family N-acetyltransferase [FCB group bacterium]|nr:GNAT family N-acetyltransferase [FCB group bacterium]